jgi:2-oxoglutarate/2-oxoacid ferredoxin oxidoreductase subunit beta
VGFRRTWSYQQFFEHFFGYLGVVVRFAESREFRGVVRGTSNPNEIVRVLLMRTTFVARSFSGDKGQLTPLIKAAIAHQGAAFLDVVSPCLAFNNHASSTKSYDYVREHNEAVNRLDFWPNREAITATYADGEVIEVPAGAEGGILKLRHP